MARIPAAELEQLKNEVSVRRLVVTPAKNLWHCFGCGAAGGPIDWAMKLLCVSFRRAVELLREGISSLTTARQGRRSAASGQESKADEQKLLNQTISLVLQLYPSTEYTRCSGL
ncbi:MAG: CHC2 zinc finger domain-containing protein [Methylococcaceae bacterium]|nr:CHC2 zinc finger domain-containing protein [Methylococcaceae bacterium]